MDARGGMMDELRLKLAELRGYKNIYDTGVSYPYNMAGYLNGYSEILPIACDNLIDGMIHGLMTNQLEQYCINLRNIVHPGIEIRDLECSSFTLYGSVTCGYRTIIMQMINATVDQKALAYIATMEEK
jgi:hypothetical protein